MFSKIEFIKFYVQFCVTLIIIDSALSRCTEISTGPDLFETKFGFLKYGTSLGRFYVLLAHQIIKIGRIY